MDDGRGGLADPWLPRHLLPVQAKETALRETKNKKPPEIPVKTFEDGDLAILFLDDRLHHLI